ncbi:MAG: carbonic anhydrase [Actinomycetota bacterium]|nr:carbonic anhydrase [Actinomycetota bacterium]
MEQVTEEQRNQASVIDELVSNAEKHHASFDRGHLPIRPARKLAILACMDSRMDIFGMLGLSEGDAHVIRNAGGVVTDDSIRSIAISQRRLGTESIVLVHHTDCGMQMGTDEDFKRSIREDVGVTPTWSVEFFDDLDEDVRESIARIKSNPFIPNRDDVRGFVYEVETGRLREVEERPRPG